MLPRAMFRVWEARDKNLCYFQIVSVLIHFNAKYNNMSTIKDKWQKELWWFESTAKALRPRSHIAKMAVLKMYKIEH